MIDAALLTHLPTAALAFAVGALFNPMVMSLRRRAFSLPIVSHRDMSRSAARNEPAPPTAYLLDQPITTSLAPTPADGPTADVEAVAMPTLLLCERTAIEHALALLRWLQEPNGLTGEVPVSEIQAIYREMLAELAWAERSWIAVGRELRKVLGQARKYANRGGQKVRVYSIPTAVRPTERIPLRRVA